MTCRRHKNGSITLRKITPWELKTLRGIPAMADPSGDERAARRLYPDPVAGGAGTEEQNADWQEYVVPDLKQLFESALDTVSDDLRRVTRDRTTGSDNDSSLDDEDVQDSDRREHYRVHIGAENIEPWFRAMNQARLVLCERHGIDSEHKAALSALLASGKLELLMQYELLAGFQAWLVEAVLSPE